MTDEPDLTAVGKPMPARLISEDGVERPYPIERTKYENCQDLVREIPPQAGWK